MLSDALHRVHLQIVPSEAVHPHEIADAARERRIESRLRQDGVLRDPILVGTVPDLADYVLLDGTNRQRALRSLDLPWIMVQVLDYADTHAVQLRTWCHAAEKPFDELMESARKIAGVETTPLSVLEAPDALHEPSTLALLLERRRRCLLRRRPDGPARADALRALVDLYESVMTRVDCDPDQIEERAHLLCDGTAPRTLIAFPPFTRSQVVTMALDGALIPAGITRHVILAGRALRVNLPLDVLRADASLEEARARLQQHLNTLQPRQYQEPTILFDS
jgi:hypothetical protein